MVRELGQFDMIVQHRSGKQHTNADSLSRKPDPYPYCDCYHAGVDVKSLPCGGCHYCSRAHYQWSRFETDVDDVIPIAVRSVTLLNDTESEEPTPEEVSSSSELDSGNKTVDSIHSMKNEDQLEMDQVSEHHTCNWLENHKPEEIRKYQLEDKDLHVLITWIEKQITPTQQDLYLSSSTVKKFWLCHSQLHMISGVLYYWWEELQQNRYLLMVPTVLQAEVLKGCHDCPTAGHLGQQKTLLRVKRKYIWHGMSTDVKIYVRACKICNTQKKPSIKPKAALGSYQAGEPMERIHIDMLGPLSETHNGNKYILLLVDQFSKWVEVHPLSDQSALQVAKTIVDQVFSRFGSPLQIHSDQGKNFDGNIFKALCHLYKITKTRTTPYRPSSNGQVERYNRLLLQMIRCYIEGKQNTWDENIQLLAAAIRAMPTRATGFSANLLFLGREVNSPIDIILGTTSAQRKNQEPAEYLLNFRKTMKEVNHIAREHLKSSQCTQKRNYDIRLSEKSYNVGDIIYKFNSGSLKGEHRKLKSIWI